MSRGIAPRALQLLEERATDARDAACVAFGKAQQTHQELARAREALERERTQPLPNVVSSALLQVHAQRRQALEKLVELGDEALAQSHQELNAHRAAVREASLVRLRYRAIAQRQQTQAAQRAMRKEQKEMDAMAAQMHLRGAVFR